MCRAHSGAAALAAMPTTPRAHQTNAGGLTNARSRGSGHAQFAQGWTRPRVGAGTRLALGHSMTAAPHLVTAPLWEDEIPGGTHWSGLLRRGVALRLIALGDDANVAALFYSREQPLE